MSKPHDKSGSQASPGSLRWISPATAGLANPVGQLPLRPRSQAQPAQPQSDYQLLPPRQLRQPGAQNAGGAKSRSSSSWARIGTSELTAIQQGQGQAEDNSDSDPFTNQVQDPGSLQSTDHNRTPRSQRATRRELLQQQSATESPSPLASRA
ncbi:Actin-like protein arp9 (SWI/SNF complex component arp9) [Hypoxylon texense]